MADHKISFSLPPAFDGFGRSGAPVVVRNAQLSVVGRTTLGAGVTLAPGYYAAQTVLPDGRELETAFKLPATGMIVPIELEYTGDQEDWSSVAEEIKASIESIKSVSVVGGNVSIGGVLPGLGDDRVASDPDLVSAGGVFDPSVDPSFSDEATDTVRQSVGARRSSAVLPPGVDALAASVPSDLRWSILEFDPVEEVVGVTTQQGNGGSMITLPPLAAAARRNRYLRIERIGVPDLNLALPVSLSESASFSCLGNPARWGFELIDDDADLALGYLSAGRIGALTDLIDSQGPSWSRLFEMDNVRPIAGTIGAYALLFVGDAGRPVGNSGRRGDDGSRDLARYLQWGEELAQSPEAPPDKHAIHGELLARQGRHQEALEAFSRILPEGLPLFTVGLRMAIDRLLSYREIAGKGRLAGSPHDLTQVVERFGRVAPYVDFDQPVMNFTTTMEGKVGNAIRLVT